MTVKLLSAWFSMFGMRAVIALKEKGVEYEYQEENLRDKSQLLLQSNPVHKKIPVLIHDGKPLPESLIIVQYIDEAWASQGASFLPKDPYDRAVARDYVDKKFYDAGNHIIKNPERELLEQAKEDLLEALTTLEGALQDTFGGGRPYFGGGALGVVDIALTPFICWFKAYETLGKLKLLDDDDDDDDGEGINLFLISKQWPHLRAWGKVVEEHPSVKEAMRLAPPLKVVEFALYRRRKLSVGA